MYIDPDISNSYSHFFIEFLAYYFNSKDVESYAFLVSVTSYFKWPILSNVESISKNAYFTFFFLSSTLFTKTSIINKEKKLLYLEDWYSFQSKFYGNEF